MKLKLIDVETNGHHAQTGTCDLCMSIMWVNEPVYIFGKEDGETIRVRAYDWSWGFYDEQMVDNVVVFAEFVSSRDFTHHEVEKLYSGDIYWLISEYQYGPYEE